MQMLHKGALHTEKEGKQKRENTQEKEPTRTETQMRIRGKIAFVHQNGEITSCHSVMALVVNDLIL